ncbi:MAG: TetR family transcriptional regulator C-terminal domain-containing protein [Bacilli bacterium]|jgi:probable dihydroxyacetone kinase regulator|nr:TetR family transcriptional regulator C-terminal domain-containing protein [Bacilli bacterium]
MSELTKKALASSLKKMLLQKPLKDITVGDLTDDCGINRQTFYYHFDNIPALIEWTCVQDADAILAENRHYKNWEEGFYSVFMLALEDRSFVMNIYHSVSLNILMRYMERLVRPLLYEVVEEQSYGLSVKDEDKEFIARFYTSSFVGLVLDWIDAGMKEDPKRIVTRLSPIVKGTFRQALVSYSKQ